MDLAKFNEIARGDYLPTKKVTELEKNHNFLVTALKSVKTRYGDRFVADLDDEFRIFLPTRVSIALEKDGDFRLKLDDAIQHSKLFVTYLGENKSGLEFSFA